MYNSYTYNAQPYNTAPAFAVTTYPILMFNNFSFETDNVSLSQLPDIADADGIEFETFDTAWDHGGGVFGWHIRRKKISAQAVIKYDTVSDLERWLSSMKSSVIASQKTLYYKRLDGKVLQTTASCTWFKTNRQRYNLTFLPLDVELTTVTPFFKEVTTSQEEYLSQSSNFTATINYTQWEVRAEPVILVNFLTGLSSVTEISVTINNRTITLSHNASDGESIQFNSETKDVSIWGTGGQNYTGRFPILDIWVNTFEVAIDGTWDADIYVVRSGTYV